MPAEKATAIVLRTVDFSETSLVVTLFTREFGKVRALAKGGRRPKSSFESALDLLALCRIVFLRKSSEALDLLTEAKLEHRFRPAGRDLSRLYAGYYVAELLEALTEDSDPHPELFDAACQALAALGQGGSSVASLVLRFELGALRWLGHLPSLAACARCGCDVAPAGRVAFGRRAGGVLCERCRPQGGPVELLSAAAVRVMQHFVDPASETWRKVSVDRRTEAEMRRVVNRFLYDLMGRKPRMHEHLAMLCS
jgi:DNA repair protein RecO (recombination protein O)